MSFDGMKEKVLKAGQGHVLKYFDELSADEQKAFAKELEAINFDEMEKQLHAAKEGAKVEKLDKLMQPLPASTIGSAVAFPPTDEMKAWAAVGLKAIADGTVAALLLAGGQGTRLGSKDPKGMFPIGLASQKTLFQLQAERILRLQALALEKHGKSCVIPWYIMVSGATEAKTLEFLKSNNYFGINGDDVMVFQQFQIPSLTSEGKLILNGKGSIAKNPDGNGGIYEALLKRGVLSDMDKRGIQHVHAYCVDNVLVKVADPCYIGFCIDKDVPVGALVVPKKEPHEKVGVVCRVDGKYRVVEYSEISAETAEKVNEDGSLTYDAGNICNHYFSKSFLDLCGKQNGELVHHVAHKKIPFLDDEGTLIKPTANNGIKLEKFIFDVFQFTERLGVLTVARSHNFSPLKNASGAADSTKETCQRDLYALHRLYLKTAGMAFVDNDGNEIPIETCDASHVCELSPLVSYAGENLEHIVKANPTHGFPATF